MPKYTLKEAAGMLKTDLFDLVKIANEKKLKPFYQQRNVSGDDFVYFSEEAIRKYQICHQPLKSFRRYLAGCDEEELEEVIETMIKNGKFKRLLLPEFKRLGILERLLESEDYEELCRQFQGHDEWYKKITDRFAVHEPLAAAKFSLENEDLLLLNKALANLKEPLVLIQLYQKSTESKSELGRYIGSLIAEQIDENIEELREEASKLGIRTGKLGRNKSCNPSGTGLTSQYREALNVVKSLRKGIEDYFGIKLPKEVRLSEPEGGYASIRYNRRNDYGTTASTSSSFGA